MIDFRDKSQAIPNAISATAVALLLVTVGVIVFVPKPSTKGLAAKTTKVRNQVFDGIRVAKDRTKDAEANITRFAWAGTLEQINSTALNRLTEIAQHHTVKLTGFRPQRPINSASLTQLPFLVTLDGAYVDVVAFEKELEDSGNRLAIEMVQVASADPSTDRVTANINLVAYQLPEGAPPNNG